MVIHLSIVYVCAIERGVGAGKMGVHHYLSRWKYAGHKISDACNSELNDALEARSWYLIRRTLVSHIVFSWYRKISIPL